MKAKNLISTSTVDPYLNYDDDFIYSDPFGAGEIINRDFLFDPKLLSTYNDIIDILKLIYNCAAVINLFINLPHLFILTRKELRSNLVYIIMIGICLCDLAHSIGRIGSIIMALQVLYNNENCLTAYPYYHLMVDIFAKCMQIMCRRCSGFLALFIAAFRAFSVLFPMSNAVNFLMKARSGYLIVLIMMVICGAWSSLYRFCTIVVKVTDECFGYTPSWVMYKQDVTGINELRLRAADGYIAIIVCILYFLVAIALVIALYNAKKRRKHLKSDKASNTSTLVIVMALLMFLSETVYGTIFILIFYVLADFEERYFIGQLELFAMTLSIINSIAHCFICFSMSSQYRDVVKGLMCVRTDDEEKIKKAISVKENNTSTVKTTKTTLSSKRTS